MQRAAIVNIGDLAAYDYAKRFLKRKVDMEEGLVLHAVSACIAGFVAAVLGTPADVIKTRVMNQPVGPDGKYVVRLLNRNIFALVSVFCFGTYKVYTKA